MYIFHLRLIIWMIHKILETKMKLRNRDEDYQNWLEK